MINAPPAVIRFYNKLAKFVTNMTKDDMKYVQNGTIKPIHITQLVLMMMEPEDRRAVIEHAKQAS